ncbi:thioredoxin (plasmid) [Haloferax mediterranei ATCC 33500]|uniref:Thioredoxin n=1 Tax=Haloferax mediterranei (strain ATCC 33500 / DSM 1411 / JCM 8866 / NBRC 14739 / NCIMB 2177 / R-4) TaxID=523841 RepID=M0IPM4_HALMT|nr:succinylglutamate desuccinylase/aspartoacylase family protein [Haloferax mediterranei]AHZ24648.1 thioredoxin [Haloferax mediterranei ATCC 33500]ELZ97419.1 DSBA-like thioredoxin [Haloferax mediterranei ATCC 33500]MDX5990286.1 succinylglutamate desuccinylase/aspartoacylase family protein [Haloferax mediterranei ATCC 33500]QCQ77043.1 thioredoxin [Haloferax mediterranei ATCC 33500]
MATQLTRRDFSTATGGLALFGTIGVQRVSAGFTAGLVGTAPYLSERLYPTMGTDDENPTLVVYVNFLSEDSQYFVQHNLEDIVREYVLPGELNVELRFLSYRPDAIDDYLVSDDEGEARASRAAHGVWDVEPENFWEFFEFMFSNVTTKSYTHTQLESHMGRSGVRNTTKIANRAYRGRYNSLVRSATEEAIRYGVPTVPRVRLLRDHKRGNYTDILGWTQRRLDRVNSGSVQTHSLLPGTKYETPVHVIDSGKPGPVAFVVGGMHGEEPEGYTAAQQIARFRPTGGKLVVLPRANQPAIGIKARYTIDGDLNRQFPTGEDPTSTLARAIWNELVSHDPDVVVDLHSSSGIYKYDGKVGQAIFPTSATPENARDACNAVNEQYIDRSEYPPYYDFNRGNSLGGSRPLLIHKVYGDLHLPGYIVETTRKDTHFEDRVMWEVAAARDLLWQHGMLFG